MSRRIIRKHDGKQVPMSDFKRVRAIVSEHFDEFVLIVKHNEKVGDKLAPVLEWGYSDPHWAQGVMLKVGGAIES